MSVEGTVARPEPAATTVWTLGHSTRTIEALLAVVRAHGIRRVADVRAFPASRRHPHFGREALERSLAAEGVEYAWMGAALGGRRRPREGSRHVALLNASFRAYADHMETPAFREGVLRLLDLARSSPTAVLCAEALWWRCHRALLADHLALVEGVRVLHLADEGRAPEPHRPRPEARVEYGHLVYDGGALPLAGSQAQG